jgi:hypothetical protein
MTSLRQFMVWKDEFPGEVDSEGEDAESEVSGAAARSKKRKAGGSARGSDKKKRKTGGSKKERKATVQKAERGYHIDPQGNQRRGKAPRRELASRQAGRTQMPPMVSLYSLPSTASVAVPDRSASTVVSSAASSGTAARTRLASLRSSSASSSPSSAFAAQPVPAALRGFVLFHVPPSRELWIMRSTQSLPRGGCLLEHGILDHEWDCSSAACVSTPSDLQAQWGVPSLTNVFACSGATARFICHCAADTCLEVCAGCAWLNSTTISDHDPVHVFRFPGAPADSWLVDAYQRPVLPASEMTMLATDARFGGRPNSTAHAIAPFDLVEVYAPVSSRGTQAGEGIVYYVVRVHWFVLPELDRNGRLGWPNPKDPPGWQDSSISPSKSLRGGPFLIELSRLFLRRSRFLRKTMSCSQCVMHRCVWVCSHADCHIGLCPLCYAQACSPEESSPNWPMHTPDGRLPRPRTCSELCPRAPLSARLWANSPNDASLVIRPTTLVHINCFTTKESDACGLYEFRYQYASPGLVQGFGCYSLPPIRLGESVSEDKRAARLLETATWVKQIASELLVIDLRCHSSTHGYLVGKSILSAEQVLATFVQPLVVAFHHQLLAGGHVDPTPAGRVDFSKRVFVVLSTCMAVASTWQALLAESLAAGQPGYQLLVTRRLLPLTDIDDLLPSSLPFWLNARCRHSSLPDVLGYTLSARFIHAFEPTVLAPALSVTGDLEVSCTPVQPTALSPLASSPHPACPCPPAGGMIGLAAVAAAASVPAVSSESAVAAVSAAASTSAPVHGVSSDESSIASGSVPSGSAASASSSSVSQTAALHLSPPVVASLGAMSAPTVVDAAAAVPFAPPLFAAGFAAFGLGAVLPHRPRVPFTHLALGSMSPGPAFALLSLPHAAMINRVNELLEAAHQQQLGFAMDATRRQALLYTPGGGSVNRQLRIFLTSLTFVPAAPHTLSQ